MTRPVHEDMFAHQLSVVLVRRRHIDLKTGLFALLGERTDDIIRFKTQHLKGRYIHRFQQPFDDRHRLANILRRLLALRLVLLVCLVTEGAAFRVKRHTDMRRIDFLQQVIQRDGKTEDRRGVLSFAVHARCADKSVVRAKNHRIRIY